MKFDANQLPLMKLEFHQALEKQGLRYIKGLHGRVIKHLEASNFEIDMHELADSLRSEKRAFREAAQIGTMALRFAIVYAKRGVDVFGPESLLRCSSEAAELAHELGYDDARQTPVWDQWIKMWGNPDWTERKEFVALSEELTRLRKQQANAA